MTTENQTARMGDDLPPLPASVLCEAVLTRTVLHAYTADQMRAYALSARELSAHGGDGGDVENDGPPAYMHTYRKESKLVTYPVNGREHVPEYTGWTQVRTTPLYYATQQPASGEAVAEVIEVASYPDSYQSIKWIASPPPAGTKLYTTPAIAAHGDAFRNAVLDHLAVAAMDAPLDEAPYKTIGRIIDWHVAVATDPAVNGGLSLQPVAAHGGSGEARSTHHVHRGPESLPCYCEATVDHAIGKEHPPASASDAEVEAVALALFTVDDCTSADTWHDLPDYGKDRFRDRASAAISALTRSPARVGGETKDARDYEALYFDLIYQVGNKYAGESRHETAKRYLQRAEQSGDSQVAKQASP